MTIYAAADGSALGNPGPAGWGWYVDEARWACGGWAHGTNNMGELKAVLDLLEQTAGSGQDLHVYCDSQYVINAVTRWTAGWKANGWRKKNKSPVLNVDLLKGIDAAMTAAGDQGRRVTFEWVRGHTGHEMNEEADRLAQGAATAFKDGAALDTGPGWRAVARGDTVDAGTGKLAQAAVDACEDLVPATANEVAGLESGMLALSTPRLGAFLHPDWVRVTAAGRTQTREEVLAAARPRNRPVVAITDTAVLGPDAVLVRSTQSMSGRQALCVSVWVRDEGRWRQRFQQFTAPG